MLIACSGGGDSTALAALAAASAKATRCRFTLAHMDHGLREGSAKEAHLVERLASQLELEHITERLPVGKTLADSGGNEEEVCRRLRYAALERYAKRMDCDAVLTGHNMDDLVETIWLWLLRGTGLRGLSPLPDSRPIADGSPVLLLRPLLEFRHDELREYLRQRGLRWLEDPSNASLSYRRNRIRHRLLPLLSEEFGIDPIAPTLRLGKQAGQIADYLDEELARRDALNPTAGLSPKSKQPIERRALSMLPPALAGWLISGRLRELGEPSANAVDRILALNRGEATGKILELPGGLVARFTDQQLFFEAKGQAPTPPDALPQARLPEGGLALPLSGEVWLDSGWSLALTETAEPPTDAIGPLAARFDRDKLKLPLRLANPGRGQWIRLLGGPGSRKLSDLFIDRKVPRPFREQYPLLIDGEHRVLWIPGLGRSELAPVTNATRRCLCLDLRGPS